MKTLLITSIIVITSLFAPAPAGAAVDYFLRIEGINGESTAPGHVGDIEVLSYSWGVSQGGTSKDTGGGGAGKAIFKEFVCLKPVDKSSPQLMIACATGQRIPTMVMAMAVTSGGASMDFYKVILENVLISSFTTDAGKQTEAGIPVESVSLKFKKITIEYVPTESGVPGTPIRAGWDLKQNKRIE